MAETPESLNFTIKDVPYGKYKSVEFLIGVDSVRNFSGAQYGALAVSYTHLDVYKRQTLLSSILFLATASTS